MNERVRDIIQYFSDFYEDFDEKRAYDMLGKLQIDALGSFEDHVQGNQEKCVILVSQVS